MTVSAHSFDVIVVGGGPAGSVMGWALAKQGVNVAICERTKFPREKVCGDYVEPGGLRILDRIGVLSVVARPDRPRVTKNRVYFGPTLLYKGPIRYYEKAPNKVDYGLIVPRHELDSVLLYAARQAGAAIFCPAEARALQRRNGMMHVEVQTSTKTITLHAPIVIGADGVESVVAKNANLRRTDRRHIGVSQRVYVDGLDVDESEATVWFDEEIAPGYGWMFPLGGGRANVGVGLSSETSHRFGIPVRKMFATAIERLRIRHPGCANARLTSKPLGGVIKTYSGIDRNHFDGRLLIGDAGSFVDPVTGEGITHAMESAILALPVLIEALDRGRFESRDLAPFERNFRRYFDPAMRYLELSAALVSNRHMSEFWLRASSHAHEEAARDPRFAKIAGAIFGGPALQPLAATVQIWNRLARRCLDAAREAKQGNAWLLSRFGDDLVAFRNGWALSQSENAEWHAAWISDVVARAFEVQKTLWTRPNPRPGGVFRFIGAEPPSASISETFFPMFSPEVCDVIIRGAFELIDAGFSLFRPAPPQLPTSSIDYRRRWRIKQ